MIAGIPPIELLARERKDTYEAGADPEAIKEAKASLEHEWQRNWQETEKGQWTRLLIPNIAIWVNRQHGEVNFHLTQILTGHGCFRDYLYNMGKDTDDGCEYCERLDSVAHTMFECPNWQEPRERLTQSLEEPLGPRNMVTYMLRSQREWDNVAELAKIILSKKEEEERRRQKRVQEQGRPG